MPERETDFDQAMIRRAIRLAMSGRGAVEPNPMVGCVLVKDRRVIGEGYHQNFGGPHAEPNALASCTESPAGATAYITLEPCCHVKKKTPPCAPRLIEATVARVVVGCLDPNPDVDGKGLAMLRAAEIEVVGPVLEDEAKQLIAPFLARVQHGRPYVTLKWAESADGKIAGPGGKRTQISNPRSNCRVHELRARSDAVLVGINTVLNDDPLLLPRGVPLSRPDRPMQRWVLDTDLQLPLTSQLARTGSQQHEVTFFCSESAELQNAIRIEALRESMIRVDVESLPQNHDGTLSLSRLLTRVMFPHVTHVMVEPGPRLAASFFEAGLADRLWVCRSPNRIDDPTAPAAAAVPDHFVSTGEINLDGDILTEYLNPRSPIFFGPYPSSDFVSP